jgi:hypothetical protein
MLRILRYVFLRQVGGARPDDVKTRLERYLGISNFIVSFGLFSVLLAIKLGLPEYVGPNAISLTDIVRLDVEEKLPGFFAGLSRLVAERWFDLIFASFVVLWFFAYRSAAAIETQLLFTFYADDNPPRDWDRISGGRIVPLVAVGITVAFLLLAWFIDDILLFCSVMLFLLSQDAFGNNMVRRNILQHYYDPAFALRDDDPMTPRLKARRDIAMSYWAWRPQLTRISLMMCATALIAAIEIWSKAAGMDLGDKLLRCGLIAVIAMNEATMVIWRLNRDEALARVDAAPVAANGGEAS